MQDMLKKVVLIDDDSVDITMYSRCIEDSELSEVIAVFRNGKAAIEWFEAETRGVDMIVLDINMPEMNGWQFLDKHSALSKKQQAKHIIVMLGVQLKNKDYEVLNNYRASWQEKPLTLSGLEKALSLSEL